MGRNFGEIRIKIQHISFKKMRLKRSSAKMVAILSRGRWVNKAVVVEGGLDTPYYGPDSHSCQPTKVIDNVRTALTTITEASIIQRVAEVKIHHHYYHHMR